MNNGLCRLHTSGVVRRTCLSTESMLNGCGYAPLTENCHPKIATINHCAGQVVAHSLSSPISLSSHRQVPLHHHSTPFRPRAHTEGTMSTPHAFTSSSPSNLGSGDPAFLSLFDWSGRQNGSLRLSLPPDSSYRVANSSPTASPTAQCGTGPATQYTSGPTSTPGGCTTSASASLQPAPTLRGRGTSTPACSSGSGSRRAAP
jgi:hypothetical protein